MQLSPLRIAAYLDGTPADEQTTRALSSFAGGVQQPIEITLLHVIASPGAGRAGDLLPLVDLAERQAERLLAEHARKLNGLPVRRVVLVGIRPAHELLAWLRQEPVGFLFAPWQDVNHWRFRRSGAAVSELVRKSPVPVMLTTTRGSTRVNSEGSSIVPREGNHMSSTGFDIYIALQCKRVEAGLRRSERAARLEHSLMSARTASLHRRLAGWLGLRLVAAGQWLCQRSALDSNPAVSLAARSDGPCD